MNRIAARRRPRLGSTVYRGNLLYKRDEFSCATFFIKIMTSCNYLRFALTNALIACETREMIPETGREIERNRKREREGQGKYEIDVYLKCRSSVTKELVFIEISQLAEVTD